MLHKLLVYIRVTVIQSVQADYVFTYLLYIYNNV